MPNYHLKELKIEVTYACPLICIHCSSESTPSSLPYIQTAKCLSIIEEAYQLGVQKIAFSGGEPLQHEGIIEMINLATSHGIHTSIYTTGNIKEIFDKLSELKLSGLKSLAFSLYSHNAREHELITRVLGSFDRTIFAIRSAIQLNIECEIHFVALNRNYSHLKDVVTLAKNLGVKKVSVLRFVPQGRGQLIYNEILTKNEFIELGESIRQLRKDSYIVRTGSPLNFLFLNDEPKCNSGLDRLLIDAELNISPCDAFKQISADEIVDNPLFSNLRDHSLNECWNNSTYLSAIRNHLESDFESSCVECNDLGKCLSGCLAQKVIQFGKLTKLPDPSCLNQ